MSLGSISWWRWIHGWWNNMFHRSSWSSQFTWQHMDTYGNIGLQAKVKKARFRRDLDIETSLIHVGSDPGTMSRKCCADVWSTWKSWKKLSCIAAIFWFGPTGIVWRRRLVCRQVAQGVLGCSQLQEAVILASFKLLLLSWARSHPKPTKEIQYSNMKIYGMSHWKSVTDSV